MSKVSEVDEYSLPENSSLCLFKTNDYVVF